MTDDRDPLEAALRSFRPRPPSPALRRRIADQLAGPAPARGHLGRYAALAGSLAAAGLALALLLDRAGSRGRDPVPPPPAANGVAPPTVLAYRRAMRDSPEALDDLLDQQARHSARVGMQARPVRAFVTSDFELLTWRGNRK
jgi:hypothetical protein